MIAKEFDLDSNFALEVPCIDGKFILPNNSWPADGCVENNTCYNFPSPPAHTNLVRADHRILLRADDKAYFVCNHTEMVIAAEGTNMFELSCGTSRQSEISWPNCTWEPLCYDIPTPSNESLLVRTTNSDKVKLGDFVVYECKNKEKYFHMPDEVTMFIMVLL